MQDWCKAARKASSLFLPSLKLHCRDEYHHYINMFFQVSHQDTCQWKHAVSVIIPAKTAADLIISLGT